MIKNKKNIKPRVNFSGAQNQVREFKSNQNSVRISSLGGFGDVTQNMFVYEFIPNGDTSKSQIIIVDCGVGFPEEDIFGVDMQIPDTHYLEDKKDRILGIFITHGHEDHIGAVKFILPILGEKFPFFPPNWQPPLLNPVLVKSISGQLSTSMKTVFLSSVEFLVSILFG